MKLIGYSPDVDPTLEGVLTDCDGIIPTLRGVAGAPSAVDSLLSTLPMTAQGAATLLKLDGSSRFFAGQMTSLLEASTTVWNDISRTSIGAYSTVNGRWRFAQFGNVSLAVSKENTLQASPSSGFADVSGAPKADIVETVNQFVFLFNTFDGTYGDSTNRWWCSALGDYTNWTPNIATQCATGLLTSVNGAITAAKRFGDNLVVFKQYGMYLGSYSGPPFIWSFQEIPTGGIGTFSQESVINIGTPEQPKLFFVGQDNFYMYDGSRPVPVGFEVKTTFFTELNVSAASKICMLHDRSKSIVYIFFPSGSSNICDDCYIYNYRTQKWGRHQLQIDFACDFVSPGVTYDGLGSYYSTYANLPNVSYNLAFLSGAQSAPAVITNTHKVKTLNGVSDSSYMVTGDKGDGDNAYLLTRVDVNFISKPSVATLTHYHRRNLGDSLDIGDTVSLDSNGRFDLLLDDYWHRVKFNFTGDFELNTFKPRFVRGGSE